MRPPTETKVTRSVPVRVCGNSQAGADTDHKTPVQPLWVTWFSIDAKAAAPRGCSVPSFGLDWPPEGRWGRVKRPG